MNRAAIAYERDPKAITNRSFAIIRAEVDLSSVPLDAEAVAVRMIHACGMVDLVRDLHITPGAAHAGRAALRAAAPILCDVAMVAAGITRARLPANNAVITTIAEPGVADDAASRGISRAAASVERWSAKLGGAVVAIGNAPTALFRLIEGLGAGWPKPALIIAVPVGFVGAVESKDALIAANLDVPLIVLRGRRGGSALAAAAVNALAMDEPAP
ncbi:MAG: precorrin-8X methylmutase [Alphaproteobacteria bacterium]|nr:precorrin-8X methylmutase [Alphaproteobacteria bacterium]